MQSLTNRSKVVSKKEMTFMERMYIPAILSGMRITMSHFFKKKATLNYPEKKRPIAEVYRGQHVLKRDEIGAERCTACGLCAIACPAEAITMTAAERKKGEEHLYRKKNMQPLTKSTCCVASSADCAKKLVRKNPFSSPIELSLPILNATILFTEKTNW